MKFRDTPKIIPAAYNFSKERIAKLKITSDNKYKNFRNSDKYAQAYEYRYDLEKKYINTVTTNHVLESKCQKINNTINFDFEKLGSEAASKFYDTSLMDALLCISNLSARIHTPYAKDNGNFNSKLFWGDLIELASGIAGTVYTPDHTHGDQKLLKKNFVIKYSDKSKIEMIHESFISMIMNRFRSQIPNFMYGFGYFRCSSPNDTLFSKRKSICNQSGGNVYGVFEKIDSIVFDDYIAKKDYDVTFILEMYLQILLSLNMASSVKFSHNDLHTSNVLLRKTPSEESVYIPYKYKGDVIYIKTKYIATIVDYGNSFVSLDGIAYGSFEIEKTGAYPDVPNYIMDAYKLFMFISYYMLTSGSEQKSDVILPKLEPIFKFFNKSEDFIDTVYGTRTTYYVIPADNYGYNHTLLIDHIFRMYPEQMKNIVHKLPPKDTLVVSCLSGEVDCSKSHFPLKKISDVEKNTLHYLKSSKNKNLNQNILRFLYEKDLQLVYNRGFTEVHKRIVLIKISIKNSIKPKLGEGGRDFKLATSDDILLFYKLKRYINAVISNFGSLILQRDALLNFYTSFTELSNNAPKIRRVNGDYFKLYNIVIDLLKRVNFIINRNEILMKKVLGNIKRDSLLYSKVRSSIRSIFSLHKTINVFRIYLERGHFSIFPVDETKFRDRLEIKRL